MQTAITTSDRPSSTPDLITTGKRRGGVAAKLATELELVQRQLADAVERSGPEFLTDADQELAGWLAMVAADSPQVSEPIEPLGWRAPARAELGELISKYLGTDVPPGTRGRAEEMRVGAAIAELCEREGCDPELVDAILALSQRCQRPTRRTVR